jgi:hypothetical protein
MSGVRAGQVSINKVSRSNIVVSSILAEPLGLRGVRHDVEIAASSATVSVVWTAVFAAQQLGFSSAADAINQVEFTLNKGYSNGQLLTSLKSENSSVFGSAAMQSLNVTKTSSTVTRTLAPTPSPTKAPQEPDLNTRARNYIYSNITIYGFILIILSALLIYVGLGFAMAMYYRMERAVITKENIMERRRREPPPTLSQLARNRQTGGGGTGSGGAGSAGIGRYKSAQNVNAAGDDDADNYGGRDREEEFYESPVRGGRDDADNLSPAQKARLMLKRSASQSAVLAQQQQQDSGDIEMRDTQLAASGGGSGSPTRVNKELARAKTRERLRADLATPVSPTFSPQRANPIIQAHSPAQQQQQEQQQSPALGMSSGSQSTSVLRGAVARLQKERSVNAGGTAGAGGDDDTTTPIPKRKPPKVSVDKTKMDML